MEGIVTKHISTLNEDSVQRVAEFIASLKRSKDKVLVIYFDDVEVSFERNSFEGRYKWTLWGQTIRDLLVGSPQLTIGVISGKCEQEIAEMAVFIDAVVAFKHTHWMPCGVPRWGSLNSTLSIVGDKVRSSCFQLDRLVNVHPVTSEEELKAMLSKIVNGASEITSLHRRVTSHLSVRNAKVDLVEATLQANIAYENRFSEINFLEKVVHHPNVTRSQGEIDRAVDDYLDLNLPLADVFKKYKKIEKSVGLIQRLFNQRPDVFRGKCIELGSGAGYFSIELSKLDAVKDALALDITPALASWLGPIFWEKLRPDWKKLSYTIGDMNSLPWKEEFDCVVFCSSLHHSSDFRASLEQARKILKKDGYLVLFSEHFCPLIPVFGSHGIKGDFPTHILDWKRELNSAGFSMEISRIPKPGNRRAGLKKWLYERLPTRYLNGYFHIAELAVIGKKQEGA